MQIMLHGLYYKFSQNPGLGKKLKASEEKTLFEASPYDAIWGIGISKDGAIKRDEQLTRKNVANPLNPQEWLGNNQLGLALMAVRKVLGKRIATSESAAAAVAVTGAGARFAVGALAYLGAIWRLLSRAGRRARCQCIRFP